MRIEIIAVENGYVIWDTVNFERHGNYVGPAPRWVARNPTELSELVEELALKAKTPAKAEQPKEK